MKVTEEYEDVLQNLESAIVATYRANRELTDHDVEIVIGQLIRVYQADKTKGDIVLTNMNDARQELFDAVDSMAKFRLGHSEGEDAPHISSLIQGMRVIDVATLLLCLKRLRKSIRFWNKKYGRQGYLDYIDNFF